MDEKELLKQLNNLKSVKPDTEWKEKSRDVLLSQISAGDRSSDLNEQTFAVSDYFRNFFHQPALVVSVILLAVLSGGIFSVASSRDAKPGDSLYIAKIISEKAQLAITFDEKNKAKLGIEFAGNRAKEIARVLAEEGNGDQQVKVEKLAHNFKKEISAAKTRLKNIRVIKDENDSENGGENNQESAQERESDNYVFSANLGKDDRGVQVYSPAAGNGSEPEESVLPAGDSDGETEESFAPDDSGNDVEQVLGEAEELFAQEDYDGASDKLEEAGNIIDQIGEENGNGSETPDEGDNATTTEEIDALEDSGEAGGDNATSTVDNN